MRLQPSIWCCWVLLVYTAAAQTNTTIQLLLVLFRHGSRTPIHLYANDANAPHFWSGLGQLTNEGKLMQYQLGQFLRQRYADFLHKKYNLNYTHVVSSDVDRTLMSAQVNLAGLYPPGPSQQWSGDLPWQPIPVHTRPVQEDLLMRFLDSCPLYIQRREKVPTLPEVAKLNVKYAGLMQYLSAHCGEPVTSVDSLDWLYDTLSIEDRHGLPIPEWARARLPEYEATVYPQLLRPLSDLAFQLMAGTDAMRRLSGGIMLGNMTARMADKVGGALQPDDRQLFIYSGHDFNVATLLSALGVYNGIAPPPAACVMVELHRHPDTRQFSVRMFYRNDSSVEPHALTLPGCARDCPWRQFVSLTAAVRVSDPAAACRVAPPGGGGALRAATIAEVVAALLLLLIVLAALVAACRARRQRRQVRYSALSADSPSLND